MSSELLRAERVVAATVDIALGPVREKSPAAAQLIALCSFLAADDVPRRMLYEAADELAPAMRAAIADPRHLQDAVDILSRYDLLSVNGDGLAFHREVQASIREGLTKEEHDQWAAAAGRIVLAAFPARPEDSRTWPWAARLLPHAIATTDHLDKSGVEPVLTIRLRDRAARYLIPQGQLAEAKSMLERALRTVTKDEPEGSLHASVLNHYAVVQRQEGFLNNAKRDAEQALAMHQRALHPIASDTVSAAGDLGVGKPERTSGDATQSREGTQIGQAAHQEIAEDHQTLAAIARLQGDTAAALEHLQAAYRMLVELYGNADPILEDALAELFALYIGEGYVGDAVQVLQAVIEIVEAEHGPEDVEVVESQLLLLILTEPDDRDEKAREFLRLNERTHGPLHPRTADACRLLGALLRYIGQLDEARRMVSRALEIDRANYGRNHFRVGSSFLELMVLDATAGESDAAADRLRDVGEIVLASPPEDRISALGLSQLGEALADIAPLANGIELVMRARKTLDDLFAGDETLVAFTHELVVKALLTGGDARLGEGEVDDAAPQYEEGLRLAQLTTENFLDDALFHVRLGLVAGIRSDARSMTSHFGEALRCLSRGGYAVPQWELVNMCAKLRVLIGPIPLAEEALADLIKEAIEGGTVPEFRGKVMAAIPEDWFAKESTTLLAPDGQANVIASSEPLDPSIDNDRYASVQGDLLESGEFPDYEEKSFGRVEIFGGRSGYLRQFEWTPPDGVPVTQLQLYYVENARGYTATATTPSEAFPPRELMLRQILLGLRLADDLGRAERGSSRAGSLEGEAGISTFKKTAPSSFEGTAP